MIEVSNIAKRYGNFSALQGVSFKIQSGEIVGLLGPNGAGKTTLIRILTGYHYPSMGEAIVYNKNVVTEDRDVKQQIGYLPENAPVYQDMYVYEYLRFIAQVRGIAKECIAERIHAVVTQCALKDVLLKPIQNISKGYRQRVGLAQAMIHDPHILILDEPTNGLDPNQIIEIRNLIRQLGKKKTVILSTHVMQEVEAICDRVLIVNDGRLVAQGTTTEIALQLRGEERYSFTFYSDTKQKTDNSIDMLRQSLDASTHIHKVLVLQKEGAHEGKTSYHAEVLLARNKGDVGGEALFHWAISENVVLTSLNFSRLKLEEIFTRLTK